MDYIVLFDGVNVFLNIDGEIGRYGFFINVYATGENEAEAMKSAKDLVKNKLRQNPQVIKDHLDAIDITVKEVRLNTLETEGVQQGFVWYRDEELNG